MSTRTAFTPETRVKIAASRLAWNGPLVSLAVLTTALSFGLLIARLPLLDSVLLVTIAVVGVATLIQPVVGVGAALFLGLLRAYLQAEIPQVPAQIGQLFLAVAIGSWLARGLAQRSIRIHSSPLLLALLLFVSAALLSLWDSVDPAHYGLIELIKWIQIVLVFLLVRDSISPANLPWLLSVLFATGLFQAAVGAYEFGLRGTGPNHFAIPGTDFYRAYGTFEQPNPYGGYISTTASLALGVTAVMLQQRLAPLLHKKNGPRDSSELNAVANLSLPALAVTTLAALAMVAALAMSWSRGAWLGFAAAVLAMALALPRRATHGLLLAACLLTGAVAIHALGLLPPSVESRLTSFVRDIRVADVRGVAINSANYAVIERLAHWQSALQMWRYHFWTGVGIGCYEPAYPAFALINWRFALGHAHNYYLTVAAETGTVGLLAYLALWATIFWQTWRAARLSSGLSRGVAIGLLGAWTHISVHHLLDNLYVNNVPIQIGIMFAMLAIILASGSVRAGRGPRHPRTNPS